MMRGAKLPPLFKHPRGRAWAAFLAFAALTIALTFPLVTELGSVLPNDVGDPALNTWILWWNAHALPYTARWWNAPAFYPIAGSLAFSEHLLGLSVIATPIQWLGAPPQVAYNIVFLLTFPLSAFGAYLLTRELTGRDDAAFIGGLLFGFAPYRIAHLPQIQCLAAFPMPFALLGLHRYLRDSHLRWLALFGASWFLQAICNGYYMLFFGVVVGLWILWFATPRGGVESRGQRAEGRGLSDWRRFAAIVAAWVIASLPLVPLLWRYREIHEGFGFTREFGTIRDFGADVAGLLNSASALAFWGWLHIYRHGEGELFPGLTIAALIVAGIIMNGGDHGADQSQEQRAKGKGQEVKGKVQMVRVALLLIAIATAIIALTAVFIGPWRFRVFGLQLFTVRNPVKPLTYALVVGIALALTSPRLYRAFSSRSVLGFYGLTAFVTWLCSLGPAPTLLGKPLMYRGVYSLLMLLPGFNSLRVPARFWMMTTICLAVVGAILFDRLASRVGKGRVVVAAIVACGVIADGWVSAFPLAKTPPAWKVEQCESYGALMELPLGHSYSDVAAMYRGMAHGHPLVNGYSGYFPPHYAALRFGLLLRDDDVLTQLAEHGGGSIAIDAATDADGSWRRYVESHAGVQVICSEQGRTLYHLPSDAPASRAPTGAPVHLGSITANVNNEHVKLMTDGDRTTRWESGPQTEGTELTIDLGDTRSVSAVQLMLGPFVEDFPRKLSIEALEAGAIWREIYRGGTAGHAFVGAFEAPKDVPLTFEFSPVSTRYLRLRLLASDETYYWSVAELKILGSGL